MKYVGERTIANFKNGSLYTILAKSAASNFHLEERFSD